MDSIDFNNLPKFKLVEYELIDIESNFQENKQIQKFLIDKSKKQFIKNKFEYLIKNCEIIKNTSISWKKEFMEKRIKEYKKILSNENFTEEHKIIFEYGDKLNNIFEKFLIGNKINNNIKEYKSLKTMNNSQFLNQITFELNNYSKKDSILINQIKIISFFLFYEVFNSDEENPITNLKREILISHLHHNNEAFDITFPCLFILNNNYIPFEKIKLNFEITNNNNKNKYIFNKDYIINLLTNKCVLPSLHTIINSYNSENFISELDLKNSIIDDIYSNKIYFIPVPENTIAGLTIYNCNIFLKLRYIEFLNKNKPLINETPQQLNLICSTIKHEQSHRNIKKLILKNEPFLNTLDIINNNTLINDFEIEDDNIINSIKLETNENLKTIEVEKENKYLNKKRKRKNITNVIKENIYKLFEGKKNINRKIYSINKLIEKDETGNLLDNILFGNKKDYNIFTFHSSVYMLDIYNYPNKFFNISFNYNKYKQYDLKLEKKTNLKIIYYLQKMFVKTY